MMMMMTTTARMMKTAIRTIMINIAVPVLMAFTTITVLLIIVVVCMLYQSSHIIIIYLHKPCHHTRFLSYSSRSPQDNSSASIVRAATNEGNMKKLHIYIYRDILKKKYIYILFLIQLIDIDWPLNTESLGMIGTVAFSKGGGKPAGDSTACALQGHLLVKHSELENDGFRNESHLPEIHLQLSVGDQAGSKTKSWSSLTASSKPLLKTMPWKKKYIVYGQHTLTPPVKQMAQIPMYWSSMAPYSPFFGSCAINFEPGVHVNRDRDVQPFFITSTRLWIFQVCHPHVSLSISWNGPPKHAQVRENHWSNNYSIYSV